MPMSSESGNTPSLRDVFDAFPLVLVLTDRAGIVKSWNAAAEYFTQIKAKDAIGKHMNDVLVALKPELHLVDKAFKDGTIKVSPKLRLTVNAEQRYYIFAVYPLAHYDEVVICVEDITQRISREYIKVQKQKMSSLATLVAGIAHEMNNPLGGIGQAVQNITRRLEPNLKKNKEVADQIGISLDKVQLYLQERKIHMFLESLQELVDRASVIIKEILIFGKQTNSILTQCSINEVIQEALTIVMSKNPDLKIELNLDNSLPKFSCIRAEIEQSIQNILTNAAYALSQKQFSGNIKAKIKVTSSGDQDSIQVIIEDNGVGINKEEKSKIFDPFYTTKPVGSGAGLGLSTAYGVIVNNHQGTIQVDSIEGEYTAIKIQLPYVVESGKTDTL